MTTMPDIQCDSRTASDEAVICSNLFRRLGVTPYYQNQWCAILNTDLVDAIFVAVQRQNATIAE